MDKRKRRYCTNCNSRYYEDKMLKIYIPLINKKFWICEKCYNTYAPLFFVGITSEDLPCELPEPKENLFL